MKRILSTLKEKWPEYLLEIFVLIIGIYGAFEVDNWNQNRIEEESKRSMLTNLRQEFNQNKALLISTRQGYESTAESGIKVLKHISEKDVPEQDQSDDLIYEIAGYNSFKPHDGALLDIINSGKVELIENDSLRSLILSFAGRVNQLNVDEVTTSKILENNLLPYLYKHHAWATMDGKKQPYKVEWPKSRFKSDLEYMYDDRYFESMIDDFTWRCFDLINQYKELEIAIDKTLELIDSELK